MAAKVYLSEGNAIQDASKCTNIVNNTENQYESSNALEQKRDVENDVSKQVELQHKDNSHGSQCSSSELQLTETKNIVSFSNHDPENPYNWSNAYKVYIVVMTIITVLNCSLASSIPSGDIPGIAEHFSISDKLLLVLPNSIFLTGYVLGPLLFSPLSERYGRQVITFVTFAGHTIFMMGVCLAPNYAGFIIFRLLSGTFASSPIAVTGGICADIYKDTRARGNAMAIFTAATTFGPLTGPLISGYLGRYGWDWPFWFVLIFAGVTWIPLLFFPETYGPTILTRRAKKLRKESPGLDIVAPIELEKTDLRELVVVILTRPVRMFFMEAIVLCSSLYLSLIYSTMYMFFQAYPLIYPPIYGFSLGEQGLAFLPNCVGAVFACILYLWWDHYYLQAKSRNAPWTKREEYRRLPIACLGGPLFTIGMFWIGWTARPSIHWIVPILGGLPFGIGFLLLFIALINYIVDGYEVFAASAMAAASCSRSAFAVVLPFAAAPMFEKLGVTWACSLLGFVSLVMCLIPFAFIRFGDRIRANSKFCQQLAEKKMLLAEEEMARNERRRKRGELALKMKI